MNYLEQFEQKQLEQLEEFKTRIIHTRCKSVKMLFEVPSHLWWSVFGIESSSLSEVSNLVHYIEHAMSDDGQMSLTRERDESIHEMIVRMKADNLPWAHKLKDHYWYKIVASHDFKYNALDDEDICDVISWHKERWDYEENNRDKIDCDGATEEQAEYFRLGRELNEKMEQLYLSKLCEETEDE